MMTEKVAKFISEHANDDVRRLAFVANETLGADAPFALDQIMGRQTARRKLPKWAATDGIVYPPHLSMEQCSSQQTAECKAGVMARAMQLAGAAYDAEIIDFTGGFGVDFSFLARGFARATYVERMPLLCEMAAHNMPLLGLSHARIFNEEVDCSLNIGGGAVDWSCGHHAVFIDPVRRDSHGGRTYAIADCTPDICGFIGDLLVRADVVMVKLSPMLDWHAVVDAMPRDSVREVHIVSVANECKELLIVMSTRYASPFIVHCVNDNQQFSFSPDNADEMDISAMSIQSKLGSVSPGELIPLHRGKSETSSVSEYVQGQGEGLLLVPNASVMKAGCFSIIESRFGVRQVAPSSHLFLAPTLVPGFPGKQYQILAVSSLNKKELKSALQGITHANISCRNFPMKPEELRKKLKLKDGGPHYLFATTAAKDKLIYVTIDAISRLG